MSFSVPNVPGAAGQAAAATSHEGFLEELGLRTILDQGVARLREVSPRPSTRREAWRVLSAQVAKDIDAEDGGESKEDVAAEAGTTLSVFVETTVRSRGVVRGGVVSRGGSRQAAHHTSAHTNQPTPSLTHPYPSTPSSYTSSYTRPEASPSLSATSTPPPPPSST